LRGSVTLTDAFIRTLEKRRTALRDAIPESFLLAYDALGRMGRHPAVVAVRKAHCGGCYLRLPPQLESDVRHRQSLRSCPHCHRLLYLPAPTESENAGAAKPEPERLLVNRPSSKKVTRFPRRRPSQERRPSAARPERGRG
jgi:hypothetical protein